MRKPVNKSHTEPTRLIEAVAERTALRVLGDIRELLAQALSQVAPHSYLSAAEVAEQTGLALSTLEQWRSRGGGPPWFRVGRRVLYRRSDVDQWLDERRVG